VVELDFAFGELVHDRSGGGQGAREPVEFRDDERVAGAARGERLVQAGAFAVAAVEPVVDVDAFGPTPSALRPSR
jgi:hypothetical protein